MSEKQTIGFIGLGAMGGPMAANLVRAGFQVRGCDIVSEYKTALAEAGGEAVESPAAAAGDVAMLLLMVATAAQIDAVLFAEDGAIGTLPAGATVVVHSTVPASYIRQLAARLAQSGHRLVDAPVSGGTVGAKAGTLAVMASGPPEAFAAVKPALDVVAGRLYHLGDEPGGGSTVKMINQLLAGVHIVSTAEALSLATRAGLDPNQVFEIISNSAGNSWMFQNRGPHMLETDPQVASAVEIFIKDLGIVLEAGKELRFPLPLTATAYQQFLAAAAAGFGREDDSAVVKVYEQLAGISVAAAAKASGGDSGADT